MTSEQRIAVEAIAFANRFSSALWISLRPDSLSLLEQMTGELIASVRAEAIEEAVKEVEWIVPRGQTGLNARLVHAIRELKTKEKVQ